MFHYLGILIQIVFFILLLSIDDNSLTLGSFNCTGIKSSIEYVSEMLYAKCDIIDLQEPWLLPHDLQICSSIHPSFCAFATSSVDVGAGVIWGRPFGGLAFLYRRSFETQLSPLTYDDDRILGLLYKDSTQSILFLNVYFPTQTNEYFDNYLAMMGRVMTIIHTQGADAVVIMGDFNANIGTSFYDELNRSCTENEMVVVDVSCLPNNSYTHVSDAHNTISWLDHVCCTLSVMLIILV